MPTLSIQMEGIQSGMGEFLYGLGRDGACATYAEKHNARRSRRKGSGIMSEIEELPMPQIAEAMTIPLNTAYSRLRLARKEFAAAVRRMQARGAPT